MSRSWELSGLLFFGFFFFSSRRQHTRSTRDWSSDECSSDLGRADGRGGLRGGRGRGDRHRSLQGAARDQGRRSGEEDVGEGEKGRGRAGRRDVLTSRGRSQDRKSVV